MRKLFVTLLMGVALLAGARTVSNPVYEARKSGVITITSIDLGDDATRVNVHAKFIPGYWIMFGNEESLADPVTGEVYLPVGSEGVTLNEKFVMPKSGEADMTIIYPPLPASTAAIDFAPDGDWAIYSVDLTGKKKPAKDKKSKIKDKPFRKLPSFFTEGDFEFSGRIKGYSPRLGVNTLMLYVDDVAFDESLPKLVNINPDGTFSRKISINAPQSSNVTIGNSFFNIFMAPGNNLEVEIDWERLIESRNAVEGVTFGGSLGQVNRELAAAPKSEWVDPLEVAKGVESQRAIERIDSIESPWRAELAAYVATLPEGSLSRRILEGAPAIHRAQSVMDLECYGAYPNRELNPGYVQDALKEVFALDSIALAGPENLALINRMAFTHSIPYMSVGVETGMMAAFFHWIMDENGGKPDAEIKRIIDWYDAMSPRVIVMNVSDLYADQSKLIEFADSAGIREDFIAVLKDNSDFAHFNDEAGNVNFRSQIVRNVAGVAKDKPLPLAWQLAVASRLSQRMSENEMNAILNREVTDPYLISRLKQLAADTTATASYNLPYDANGQVMRTLIKPFEGKYLFVDFWGVTCGPCRAGIQNSAEFRAANRNNPDFDFLYLSNAGECSQQAYDKYVSGNLADDHHVRVNPDDFNRLRDLFGFSAIPRYVIIGPDGKVIKNNAAGMWEFRELLNSKGIEFVP